MTQTEDGFMKEFERALNRHDLDETMSLIDDQAIFLFSDESVHVGKKAIERAIRHNFSAITDDTYSLDNLTWLAKSRVIAACVYDFAWSGTINGQPASGAGRGTTVLRRSGQDWKVAHEHLSRGKFGA